MRGRAALHPQRQAWGAEVQEGRGHHQGHKEPEGDKVGPGLQSQSGSCAEGVSTQLGAGCGAGPGEMETLGQATVWATGPETETGKKKVTRTKGQQRSG